MSDGFSTFSFPTLTVYGAGALSGLPERLRGLGIKRPLVVTDPGLLETPAFGLLRGVLGSEQLGDGWMVFSGVHPNPIEQDVREAAAAYREGGCDGVIAFGGGSAMDVGKAARLLIKQPGLDLGQYDYKGDWSGLVPFICVPTTAGTGSEVGRSAVVTLRSTGRKSVLFHPSLLADFVILDPEVTRNLPARLTAATGADALVHCVESVTSPVFHPICDGVALEGIHLIVEALPRAFRNGNDLEARGRMLVAAAMGAIAFQKDLGATHSMAHPLSTLKGMHHGTANAVCLPVVMRFNASRRPGLYRRIGLACGLDVVRQSDKETDALTVTFVEEFLSALELRPGLRGYGVTEKDVPALAEQAFQDGCHRTNPVAVSEEDFRSLYLAAL